MIMVLASGNIQAIFDNCSANQNVELVPHELQHGFFQLGFAHLAVAHADARLRHQFLQHGGARPDGIDAIVQEIDLPAAGQLQLERGADQLRLKRRHHGVDRQPVLGRRLDHRHIAQAQQRHVQCARNGSGAHGDHVHRFFAVASAAPCA